MQSSVDLYSESWKMVDNCAKVEFPLLCNLTEVFTDPYETYYVNVTAILGDDKSTPTSYKPFKPIENSECILFNVTFWHVQKVNMCVATIFIQNFVPITGSSYMESIVT